MGKLRHRRKNRNVSLALTDSEWREFGVVARRHGGRSQFIAAFLYRYRKTWGGEIVERRLRTAMEGRSKKTHRTLYLPFDDSQWWSIGTACRARGVTISEAIDWFCASEIAKEREAKPQPKRFELQSVSV